MIATLHAHTEPLHDVLQDNSPDPSPVLQNSTTYANPEPAEHVVPVGSLGSAHTHTAPVPAPPPPPRYSHMHPPPPPPPPIIHGGPAVPIPQHARAMLQAAPAVVAPAPRAFIISPRTESPEGNQTSFDSKDPGLAGPLAVGLCLGVTAAPLPAHERTPLAPARCVTLLGWSLPHGCVRVLEHSTQSL